MKRIASIILLIFPLLAVGQSVGIKGGLVFSNTDYSTYIEEKTLIGSNFGLIYQHNFNRINLSIEPGFVSKGFSDEYKLTDNSGNFLREEKAKFKFSYFELPILIGYDILNKDLYAGLNIGISPNFLLSAKMKSPFMDADLKENNSFVLDFIGGGYIGYKINDNISTSLNFRYGKGLGKVNDNANNSYNYFATFLNIGYKF